MSEVVKYEAAPTCARFHNSRAEVRGIRGPRGSGKTTACCFEMYILAHHIEPCRDGIRKSRFVVVRNTYGELKSTTIKTWEHWFGPRVGLPAVVFDTPIRWRKTWTYENQPPVQMEVFFLALDRPDDVKKLKSLESTYFYNNEASELPKEIIDMETLSHGRYPSASEKPDHIRIEDWPSHHGIIMDTNSMDDDHWWYRLSEIEKPAGYEFFDQPGGFSEDAENLQFLPGGRAYYDRAAVGKRQEWIDVYINNQYGTTLDGRPVYPEFNKDIHVSKQPLEIYRGIPLMLGWDFGLTPACAVTQLSPTGQWRILREFAVVGTTMAIKQFATNTVIPGLNNEFKGMEILSYGDPGGEQRSQSDESQAIKTLTGLGIRTKPAHTNLFKPRRDSVGDYMSRLAQGAPAFIIDPSCKRLIKACTGAYKFRRKQVAGFEEKYMDVPDKNQYSHIGETIQYVAVEISTKRETKIIRRKRERTTHIVDRDYGG
jgi:hypothetical protein